ncbi:alpha/beta fold hydrolase [Mycobacterium sp. ACS1612]|uniref:alpha/beta fold hydrolase n=1 Tax=Mycobacterium sp. ACS1612 TaxID=1834117 RepID=UPI003512A2AB
MKSLLVGAAACAALAGPAVVSRPGRDSVPDIPTTDSNLKTITLHGDRVAYRDEGAGEVLLLVHGMGGSSATWSGVIRVLAERYRVIAPDLLGHGDSDKPRGDYSVGAFAVLLRDLLDALGVSRVTVVGHSLGGGIAMQFAHQHSQYCERIALISSGGFGGDVGRVLRLLSLPGSELVLPVIASRPAIVAGNAVRALMGSTDRFKARPSLSNRDHRQAFLRTLRSVVDFRGQAVTAVNRLTFNEVLPALIISGDQDRVIPVDHALAAHRTLPNSRLHIMPGVGHHPPTERPEAVARLIDDFVATTTDHAPRAA